MVLSKLLWKLWTDKFSSAALPGVFKEVTRSSYILICYFTNWAQYRTGIGRYVPQQIDPFLCTHLIYAFAVINEDHQVTTSDANDETFYAILNGLKRKNLHLKTLLSIGGFQFGSSRFNSMVPTHATRLVFIKSAINFLRQYEFDGLDLAWLYPGAGGNPTENKKLYTKLVRELNLAFINEVQRTKQPRLLLSASMSAGKQLIDDSYEIDKLADYLDFMIVMAFDFHGPWDTFIGHHSPLYQRKDEYGHMKHLNVDFAVKYYRTKGSPGHKLLVGIPTYGRTFSLQTSDITIGAPVNGPGPKAKYTNQDGIMGYFEICEFLKSAELHWDTDQLIPYAAKGRIWVGYDNLRSLDMKVHFMYYKLS
ncbi:acidic mammalian chitinase-like [Pristis pectinata]|uniref:acidic mammalian chitinase-like n=1 Tax=Pristis pectinata TaxID=685728 RepID=UPI00223E48FD|nr:acidic mammalian chitinase-like [Pristis pectinata]